MNGPHESIVRILKKSIGKEALTAAESAELQEWRAQSPYNEALLQQVTDPAQLALAISQLYQTDRETVWNKVQQRRRQSKVVSLRKVFSYAAAVVLLVGAGTYLWLQRPTETAQQQTVAQEIAPGTNKATLTLSNGSLVQLDSADKREIREGDTRIQQQGGQLVYATVSDATVMQYNTLTTPRGGQFMVNLPDGSRVWLNAASSLKYPTAFSEAGRHVELTGEGYFEVAKAATPFHVQAGKVNVEVLGTHFNVMAYEEEQYSRITLLEGSVRLSEGKSSAVIKPGERGLVEAASEVVKVQPANTEEDVAWKNGYFWFTKADPATVLRQLGRWYDVEVVGAGNIGDRPLTGKFYRSYNLSQVLAILAANNIHCTIENKKLIVLP